MPPCRPLLPRSAKRLASFMPVLTDSHRVSFQRQPCARRRRRGPRLMPSRPSRLHSNIPTDTTTCSSCSSSETPVLESLACSCDLPTTLTPSPTSPQLVSTSYASPHPNLLEMARLIPSTEDQDDRTGRQDREAADREPTTPPPPAPPALASGWWAVYLHAWAAADLGFSITSGIPPARSVSGPSPPRTTVALTASALSTMLPIWTRSTT